MNEADQDKWTVRWSRELVFQKRGLDKDAVLREVTDALDQGSCTISVNKEPPPSEDLNPPYGIIYSECMKGKIVPFLGAGVSFMARPDPSVPWDINSDFPPSGTELSQYLAAKAGILDYLFECEDLARVASYYYEVLSDPDGLREELSEIFTRSSEPSDVHKLIAELPTPMLIVTTNYDELTEKAFDEIPRPYDVVVHKATLDNRGSVLVKKHGRDKFVSVPTVDLAKEVERH
jgi:hypothetical protein